MTHSWSSTLNSSAFVLRSRRQIEPISGREPSTSEFENFEDLPNCPKSYFLALSFVIVVLGVVGEPVRLTVIIVIAFGSIAQIFSRYPCHLVS